jgi:hypothetical protein
MKSTKKDQITRRDFVKLRILTCGGAVVTYALSAAAFRRIPWLREILSAGRHAGVDADNYRG